MAAPQVSCNPSDFSSRSEEAQNAIERQLLELETLYRTAPVGLGFVDSDLRFLRVNERLAEIDGLPIEAHTGRHVRDVLPEVADVLEPLLQRVLQTGKPLLDWEIRGRSPSDPSTERVWLTNFHPVKQGEIAGVTAAVEDVTGRKHSERELARHAQELARSNAELQQFAYVASHDLQEPLRIVSSYAQMFATQYQVGFDPQAQEYLQFMLDATDRMQNLIQSLLLYSQAINVESTPLENVSLTAAAHAALLNLDAAIKESQALIDLEELPVARHNQVQLAQVFQNLISNAIKYRGSERPRIQIKGRRRRREWQISVADNGIGIASEYRDHIFQPFTRLHGREISGTGIGLAICKRIVERHGGRIWVESEPARGSIFWFTLPAGNR